MAASKQLREIRIKVDAGQSAAQIKKIADSMGGMNRNIKSAASSLSFFRNAFTGIIAGIGIREIANISDSMQSLGARIQVLGGASSNARETLGDLAEAASRSKTSVDALATIFARLAAATKETGIRTGSLIALTETLQNTFRLSGATTGEATSAAIQLSQGLASGQLRGQELRSVLEANVVIGDILSKSLGKTRGELYKLAEAGGLTSGVVLEALAKSMDTVNANASKLGQTIEQSVVVVFNKLKLAIFDLNKELGISDGIAFLSKLLVENMDALAKAIGVVAVTSIPFLLVAISKLQIALYGLAVSNPIIAGLTLLGAVVFIAVTNFDSLKKAALITGAVLFQVIADLTTVLDKLRSQIVDTITRYTGVLIKSSTVLNTISTSSAKTAESFRESYREISRDAAFEEKVAAARENERLARTKFQLAEDIKRIKALFGVAEKEKKIKEVLADLNKEYITGKITAAQYYNEILNFDAIKLFREFRDGKIDLEKYQLALRDITQVRINKVFNEGSLSLKEFNEQSDDNSLDKLNIKLKTGTITLLEFNEEFNKLTTKFDTGNVLAVGAQSYIESIGSTASQVSDAIKGTFTSLENSLADFVKNGKFNFNNFAQSVLDDLTRIIIRAQIIAPLAQGLLGSSTTTVPTGGTTLPASNPGFGTIAAKGASFENGIRKFARGGIVSSPTMFGYGSGNMGLMGEAGTEAILPLSRGSNGNLGVQASVTPVTVNIINNGNSDVSSSESVGPNGQRTIDILIQSKVKEGFANGTFDKTLKQTYGLQRKGS